MYIMSVLPTSSPEYDLPVWWNVSLPAKNCIQCFLNLQWSSPDLLLERRWRNSWIASGLRGTTGLKATVTSLQPIHRPPSLIRSQSETRPSTRVLWPARRKSSNQQQHLVRHSLSLTEISFILEGRTQCGVLLFSCCERKVRIIIFYVSFQQRWRRQSSRLQQKLCILILPTESKNLKKNGRKGYKCSSECILL